MQFAIRYLLSALGYRLSAIGYRLSAIGYRLSAIGYWLLAIPQEGSSSPLGILDYLEASYTKLRL